MQVKEARQHGSPYLPVCHIRPLYVPLFMRGYIAYFNLADWWLSSFSPEERDWIESEQSKGTLTIGQANQRPLTTGTIVQTSQTSTMLLHEIACAVYRRLREKALGVFHKAEEDGLSKLHLHPKYIVDLHFVYHSMIELNYRDREQFRDALEIAVGACRKQIALAPRAAEVFKREWKLIPRPVGFWQLAVILEKQGNYNEAIALATQALEQGWAGDWEKRIARCKQRLVRRTSTVR
jgi:tetratricopeptide (TPR) repeat protein